MNRDRRRLALFTIKPRVALHAHNSLPAIGVGVWSAGLFAGAMSHLTAGPSAIGGVGGTLAQQAAADGIGSQLGQAGGAMVNIAETVRLANIRSDQRPRENGRPGRAGARAAASRGMGAGGPPGDAVSPGDLLKARAQPGGRLTTSANYAKPSPSFCVSYPAVCSAAGKAASLGQRVVNAATAGASILLTPSPIAHEPPVPPVPMRLFFHRNGGGSVAKLRIRPAETKLEPPGISLLLAESPLTVAMQVRAEFAPGTRMWDDSHLIGSATIEDIRLAGFDVMPKPTDRFANHYRLIHPLGVAGFSDKSLGILSKAFFNTPIP